MSRFKLCMLILVFVPSAAIPAGCNSSRYLFSRAKLPPHQLDFSSEGRAAAAGGHKTADTEGRRKWRYIVIHHSATDRGNAAVFGRAHRKRGWDELGYHFVIDNGKGGPDGRVETGSRWVTQKWGAHCGGTPGNEYNSHGIGICLVGRFDRSLPSPAQLAALDKLVTELAETYHIPARNIISHRDAPHARTACPGDALHSYIQAHLRNHVVEHMASTD